MAKRTDIIYGIRSVIEAIRAGKDVEKILIRTGLRGDLSSEMMAVAREFQVPFQYVPLEKINRIYSGNHQGVIAFVSPITYDRIENILPGIYERGDDPFILVLDQITDVRNLGAISRSAESAGVHAIIVPEKGSAMINADAVKTSAGALNLIPVVRTPSLKNTLLFLRDSGLSVFAATEKAESVLYSVNLRGPVAIVMGSEESGISPDVLRTADHLIKIPLFGKIGSLNVSAAASIVMFEVVRQRMQAGQPGI